MNRKLIKIILYKLLGKVYIPNELRNSNKQILLHISDTPEIFYPTLKKIIKIINPKYIVHTGDFVDNIKLEIFPSSINRYENKLKILIDMLESSLTDEIYLCIGNHDKVNLVKKISKRSTIIEGFMRVNINNVEFTLSHFPESILKNPSEYNLFGHNLMIGNIEKENRIYLNGIMTINIINLVTKQVIKLPYPLCTDENRLCKGKIGF